MKEQYGSLLPAVELELHFCDMGNYVPRVFAIKEKWFAFCWN